MAVPLLSSPLHTVTDAIWSGECAPSALTAYCIFTGLPDAVPCTAMSPHEVFVSFGSVNPITGASLSTCILTVSSFTRPALSSIRSFASSTSSFSPRVAFDTSISFISQVL